MLFEPPIDELAKIAGCRYAVAVIVGARAKDLENKIPNNVIPAVEFDVWCGYVFMHLLAYGIDVNSEHLKPFLAKYSLTANTQDLYVRSKSSE